MLTCRVARASILRELDRELSVDEALALDEHLAQCAACRVLSERAAMLDELVGKLAEPPIERLDLARNAATIRERIEALEAARAPARRMRRVAASAAVVALVACAALLVIRQRNERAAASPEPAVRAIETLTASAPRDDSVVDDHALDAEPAIDAGRLEAARAELRRLLADAGASLPALAATERAQAMANEIDAAVRGPALADWPVLRLAAGLTRDADASAARAALRYLGARGDRFALRALEQQTSGDPLAQEALLALLDLGEPSCDAIARALRNAESSSFTLRELARWPAERAVRVLDSALRRGASDDGLIVALAQRGAPAVPAILALARDGLVARDSALDLLATMPEAPRALAALLASSERIDDALAIAACARLQPPEALPWLAARCRDSRLRESALASLAAYADPAAFELLLDLTREHRLTIEELDAPVSAWLARDGAPLLAIARNCIANDPARASLLLEALVDGADRGASACLAVFAASNALAEQDRELAARAIGDFGGEPGVRALSELVATLDARERRLAAVCVDSLHRIGGDDAVIQLFAGAPRHLTERVLAVLRQRSPQSVSLVQLARALEPLLDREPPTTTPTRS